MNAKSVQHFNEGISRYEAGEDPQQLIPIFQELGQEEPEEQSVWVCLSWLYLLANQPEEAVKAARKAVFYDRDSAQAHLNLTLALLDSGQQGASYHLQQAQELLKRYTEQRKSMMENFQSARQRRPDWVTIQTIQRKVLSSW